MNTIRRRPLPRRFNQIPGNKLWYRNMQGSPTRFVTEGGRRDFSIELPDALAEELEAEGWTCISHKPKVSVDPDSPIIARFKVKMNFDGRIPPRIYIAGEDDSQRTLVDESFLDDQAVDSRRIAWCNVEVNPYVRDNSCTAYLSEITIKFDDNYAEYTYGEDGEF